MKKILLLAGGLLLAAAWLGAEEAEEAPPTKVYAIVKMGDGRLQVIRAQVVEKRDPALFITNEEGVRKSYQLNMLIDVAPFYMEDDVSLPEENIQRIMGQYDSLIGSYPELGKALAEDRGKYAKILADRKQQAAEREREKEQLLKDFTAEEFVDRDDLKLETVSAKLAAGEQLKARYPEYASQVDEYLKPWLDRQAILKEGKTKWEGEWRTAAEVQKIMQERRAERLTVFIDNLKPVAVSNTVAQPSTMLIVLVCMALCALVSLFCFYYAVFQSRVGGFLEFIMLIVSVLFIGVYAFYAIRIFNAADVLIDEPAKTDAEVTLDKVYQLLYISQGDALKNLKKSDLTVALDDAEINRAITKLLQFRQDTSAGSFGLAMEKIRFQSLPAKLQFRQQVSCLGKNFLLRYDLHFQATDDAITFYKCDVYLGETALPAAIGNRLWREFFGTIQSAMQGFNISVNYHIQKIEEGKLTVGYVMPGSAP